MPHQPPTRVPPLAGLFGELSSPHCGKKYSSQPPPPPHGDDGLPPHCQQRWGSRATAMAAAMAGAHQARAVETREEASPDQGQKGQGLAGRIGHWP
jgi:hypothetical protein